ncbi:MAG: class I SAM-dependent methyltransferase [Erysipelotrichaceae bacterium]|nr:class I SAM-dependent methyltransferase [Erysipelotrichaceae bacterium]
MEKKYYEAYEERYKTIHEKGYSWSSDVSSPIVMEIIRKYDITFDHSLLEIGCGEGRDSKVVLESGYHLLATDISSSAIQYCKMQMPKYESNFVVVDCLSDTLSQKFDYIFAVAVIHMLVLDEDRDGFYQFVHTHLNDSGIALICTMGDGTMEMQSDIHKAFDIQEREHETGKVMVAGTSCRMVSFKTFEEELTRNQFEILEKGITSALPDFNRLMYVVVRKNNGERK